ncbi:MULTISPECIES: hypothetical protein [Aneurinibacillus]|jgi:hypothetical protein|uniref:PsbP C-terminal domain-containing protein n=1 Tax=Aneurinibacillus thermoaerophilus TaxID=143495 RepID=A0A1G8AG85_ANETH|nr:MULTISPECIES: hypothetical protein [Aneurinibacillus]AMA73528.1 hypothetical protein ACH33_12130 [Aneurinibacillus sp. XH2]MED0677666.1 hypothetical protein [Aneurinibacillus thermoaerophilus]MED0679683.1 hypothetical protein [Aneurinibacillus thermoaerophilus]MED0737320.1 hypothetical protein [Aneurinibacillus thermoaerophilus]MED0756080.1 hypothetical protein [Aneurinibacillus thermoaerophilus]
MKLSTKLLAFMLGICVLGTASALAIIQPDVRADDIPSSQPTGQQTTPVSVVSAEEAKEKNVYTNEEMGFSLHMPASWEGKYRTEQTDKNWDGFPAVIFSDTKHSFELLEIVKIPEKVWNSEDYNESLYLKLAKRDSTVYAALFPSETLFVGDQEVTEISDMLNDMYAQIKTSFKLL